MAGGSLEVLAGEGRKKGKLLRWTEATKRGRGGEGEEGKEMKIIFRLATRLGKIEQ